MRNAHLSLQLQWFGSKPASQLASQPAGRPASRPVSQPASQDPAQTFSRAPLQNQHDFFHKVNTNPSLFGKIRPSIIFAAADHSRPTSQPASQPARQHKARSQHVCLAARRQQDKHGPHAPSQHFGPLIDLGRR